MAWIQLMSIKIIWVNTLKAQKLSAQGITLGNGNDGTYKGNPLFI